MIKAHAGLSFFLLLSLFAKSQTFNKTYWHFGETSRGLYFDTAGNPPVVTNDSYTPYTNEGCSVYNDPNTGDLKFYTDGIKVVDAGGAIMPNGSGLQGNISCAGSGKIAADPTNCERVFIFHNNADMSFGNGGTVRYSVVDMTLEGNGDALNPLGDVVPGLKNITIANNMSETMELVPQKNSRNYWLLIASNTAQSLSIYFFDETGVNFVEEIDLIGTFTDIRAFKMSPNLEKGCISSLRENESTVMFDFDALTGEISNQQFIPGTPLGNNNGWYGIMDVEWSADNSKLYLSKYRDSSPVSGGKIYQYDLDNPGNVPVMIYQVSNSTSNLGRGLRRGPDDKIYYIYHSPITSSVRYIGVINNPNLQGLACAFDDQAIDMGASLGGVHLFPTFLVFKNTIPEVEMTVPYELSCANANEPVTFDLDEILIDEENDSIIIGTVTTNEGSVELIDRIIYLQIPDGYEGQITVHVNYCDDYCFPLCEELDIVLNIVNIDSSPDILPDEMLQCGEEALTLDSGLEDYDVLWSTGETATTISVISGGEYSFYATNESGCEIMDTTFITFFVPGNLIEEESIYLCEETSVTLSTSIAGAELLWSTGDIDQQTIADESGIYTLLATWPNECEAGDTIEVEFFNEEGIPINMLEESITVCDVASLQIGENIAGLQYEWSTGATQPVITVSEDGEYSVYAYNEEGCAFFDTTVVTFFEAPILLEEESINVCDETSVTLSTTISGAELIWSTGDEGQQTVVEESGIYMLTATWPNECSASDDIEVEFFNDGIVPDMLEDELVVCGDASVQIGENIPGLQYEWSTGATLPVITVSEGGEYSVYAYTESGCDFFDTTLVTFFEMAEPLEITDITTCLDLITLTSNIDDGEIEWSTGESTTSIEVSESGLYTIEVTWENGCSVEDFVTVIQQDEITNLGPDIELCEGESATLSTTWPEEYEIEWSTSETTADIVVTETGIFSVVATSPEGCVSEDEVEVTFFEYPLISLGDDTFLCASDELQLSVVPQAGFTYEWSTSETGSSIQVTSGGTYSITVFNGPCTTSDDIEVVLYPLPFDPFDSDITFCPFDETVELNALNDGSQFLWNEGETEQTINSINAGVYSVEITTAEGCSATYDVTLEAFCPGVIYIPNCFTPDADGINDQWWISGVNIEEIHVKLFNRWGELFWESDDLGNPWTGQRGEHGEYYVPDGVYTYLVTCRFADNPDVRSELVEFRGHVTLIR